MNWGDLVRLPIPVVLGLLGQRYLNRHTRQYERETKRLQLLKAFYELQVLEKPFVSYEFDDRCKGLLEDTRIFLESRKTEAQQSVNWLLFGVAFLPLVYYGTWLAPYIGRFVPDIPAYQPLIFCLRLLLWLEALAFIAIIVRIPLILVCRKPLEALFNKYPPWRRYIF